MFGFGLHIFLQEKKFIYIYMKTCLQAWDLRIVQTVEKAVNKCLLK